MVALSLQTLLLMAVAYLLGAMLACFIRRALFRPAAVVATSAERRVDPLPEVQAAAARVAGAAADVRPPEPPVVVAKPAVVAAAAQGAQDLKRICLIDPQVEASLNKLGVTRYEQMAAWMRADVDRVEQSLSIKGRVARENWVEQAQILAKGGETQYSSRRARGEFANAGPTPDVGESRPKVATPTPSLAPAAPLRPAMTVTPRPATGGAAAVAAEIAMPPRPPAPAPQRPAQPPAARPAAPASPPDVATRAAFAEPIRPPETSARPPMPETPAAVAVRPAQPSARDNLQRISGIDAQTEQRLAAMAVMRYSQIAGWQQTEVQRFERELGMSGRISRENWIEQAQILSRGGDTAYSREFDRRETEAAGQLKPARLVDALRGQSPPKPGEDARTPATRGDIGALRSVRSQAYSQPDAGSDAERRSGSPAKMVRSAALDDLKRIRGIGVLIEKKLNSMGVVAYEQIANWTAGDIDRVSQSLDFKGRIERENWVEQARILASGGHTEFSKRVDRGEIETSKLKT